MTSDDRLTSGLILDVLERRGYHQYDHRHTGQAIGAMLDLAAACADGADQTCQSRLRDAQAYDQMAAQMLQTATAARTANSAQPRPGSPPVSSRQPHPAAGKEADR